MDKMHSVSTLMIDRSLDINKDPFRPKEDDEEVLGPETENGSVTQEDHGTERFGDRIATVAATMHGSTVGTATVAYTETPNNVLVRFADAGYLLDPHKGRSQTGYVFTIRNMTISWRSTKQTLVATSSNHAEIIALHKVVRECVWLRSIIGHIRRTSGLRSTTDKPTCIYEEYAACIEQMKLGYIKGLKYR
ncbi:hypothetical protein ACLB2K_053270 [Fragaria x ananassa]